MKFFDGKSLALMGMLIALNLAIGGLVAVLKLPIFLDSIGTILAVMILGWRRGVIVGALSFVLASALINPVYMFFIGTQIAIATFIWVAATYFSGLKNVIRSIPTGILLGVVAGIVSAPVIVVVFGGVAGSGRDLITAALMSSGEQVIKAVALSGVASEPIDKTIQVLASYFILTSLPKTLLEQFRNPLLIKNGFLTDEPN